MKKLFDIFLSIVAIILLLIALFEIQPQFKTQPQYYFVFLQWYIFLFSIYLFTTTLNITLVGRILAFLFFAAIAVIFNPFLPFAFSERTWRGIFFVIILILGLLLTINIPEYLKTLSRKGDLLLKLIKHIFLIGIITFIPIGIIYYAGVKSKAGVDMYHDFLFLTNTSIAKGFIITSDEYQDKKGQHEVPSQKIEAVGIDYIFTTKDGRKFIDSTFVDITKPRYFAKANLNPIPIEVVYIPTNPNINYIKNLTTKSSIFTEFIFQILGLGLFVFVFGVFGIELTKSELKEINEIRIKIRIETRNETKMKKWVSKIMQGEKVNYEAYYRAEGQTETIQLDEDPDHHIVMVKRVVNGKEVGEGFVTKGATVDKNGKANLKSHVVTYFPHTTPEGTTDWGTEFEPSDNLKVSKVYTNEEFKKEMYDRAKG